ncbi:MAG: SPOR domain-containing protein [Sphingomonadaceae bacterium]|nr:SPOR domain-containing protein [Sphingomonadaceae bacterium]
MQGFGGDEDETSWDDEDGVVEDIELALAEDEDRLPWLESGEYDDEEEGVDTARILGLALLGLLLIGLVLGGFWYFNNRQTDPELVADGSTIEAPPGDYKERPDDPGGKEFEGTGDTSFAVGEGQSREGRLAQGNSEAPKPSIGAGEASGGAGTAASTAGAQEAPASGGTGVQVGAFSSRESAVAGWGKLSRQTDKLSGVKYRVVEGQADIGKVYRLQAVAGDTASAQRLCNALKAEGIACQVK